MLYIFVLEGDRFMHRKMTEQEIIMLGVAIDSHVKMLLNEEEAYKRNGNTEAVKECLDEVRRFKELKEKLEI